MPSTWYRVGRGRDIAIDPVEVEKTSAHYVWVKNGRREGIDTAWHQFFPTWEAAHTHLLARGEIGLKFARRELELAQGYYGNVKGLKPPGNGGAEHG